MPKATPDMLKLVCEAAGIDSLPESVLRHDPLGGPRGAKLLVVSRAPVEQVGRIHVPTAAQRMENDGWVIAASHDVGRTLGPYLVVSHVHDDGTVEYDPWSAMGLHLAWGKFVGTEIDPTEPDTSHLKGRVLLMVEADALTVLGRLPAGGPKEDLL